MYKMFTCENLKIIDKIIVIQYYLCRRYIGMDEIQRMQEHLYAEIIKYPDETEMLKNILDVFVDYPEKYKQEDRESLMTKANLVTPSILAGTVTRKAVSTEWMQTASALGVAVAIATEPVGNGRRFNGGMACENCCW